MNNFIIFILFSLSAITIAFPNTENEENNLNYQARNLYWCRKFCTPHTHYYHDNKVSSPLMKIKCKVCNKYFHLTTSLAPNLMVQTSAATAAATTTTATATTTTTLATTKSIVTIKPVIDNTKSTIKQTTVTSTTPIAPSSTTLSTTTTTTVASTTSTSTAATTSATTFATTTISAALKNDIQKNLDEVKRAIKYIKDVTPDVERIKTRMISKKKEMIELEKETKMTDSTSLTDIKDRGMAFKVYIIDQLKIVDEIKKKEVPKIKMTAKDNLANANKKATKIGLDISKEIQVLMDDLEKSLKTFDDEYKITIDEGMKAIAIYDNEIDKLMK